MSKPVNTLVFTLTLAAASGIVSAASSQVIPPRPQHVFFGDSDLEQGNHQLLSGATEADLAPYFCSDGLCRDSNGPVWVERLGLDIQPVLSGLVGRDGLNFAVSGAHMTDRGEIEGTGVANQIALFADLVGSGQLTVGRNDRFYIHAGSNDLTRLLDGETSDIVGEALLDATGANVDTLAGLGARTIYVAEVMDVSLLPMLADVTPQTAAEVSGLVAGINREMDSILEARSGAALNIVQVRQNAFLDYLADNAARLGFEAPFNTPCFDGQALCSPDRAQQNRYVFFDPNHFSARAHDLLARWYLATRDGAEGRAAEPAARLPDLLIADHFLIARLDASGLDHAGPSGFSLTMSPVYSQRRLRATGSAPQLTHTARGGQVNLRLTDEGRSQLGLSAGWAGGDGDFADGSGLKSRQGSIEAYADHRRGGLDFIARASYALGTHELRRETGLPGLVAQAEFDSRVLGAGLGLRRSFSLGSVRMVWESRADYVQTRIDGASERGAEGLALAYDEQTHDQLLLTDNLDMRWTAYQSDRLVIAPVVGVTLSDKVLGRQHNLTSRLIDNSAQPADTASGLSSRFGAEVRLGLEASLDDRWRLGVRYQRALAGDDRDSHVARLSITAQF
ncbi:MAG: autotransporter domain-containing protein [Caulobacteraceae bacterium]|nr:autotransporter domain-containing protein [Caulobacteraceae bacterium]